MGTIHKSISNFKIGHTSFALLLNRLMAFLSEIYDSYSIKVG